MHNFPFFIARRYLISKKSNNIIHWISRISIFGVSIGTMAMVIVLAVFSGLNELIQGLFSGFNPDLELVAVEGKRFKPDEKVYLALKQNPGIKEFSSVLEDNVLVRYDDAEIICKVKAVDSLYENINSIRDFITEGEYTLKASEEHFAVLGRGIALSLEVGLNYISPLVLHYPKAQINPVFPEGSIQRELLFPAGIFEIQHEIDFQYILVDMEIGRKLFGEAEKISAIEIRTKEGMAPERVRQELQAQLGDGYIIRTQIEQEDLIFKTMQSEKLISFLLLAFIVLIASFNIIGSLSMLILDKKKDVKTLRNLGAEWKEIRKIFFYEGWMISLVGLVIGVLLGLIICWLQNTIGIIPLQGEGNFIVDYYPVKVEAIDLLSVIGMVFGIGFLAAWYPTKILIRRLILEETEKTQSE
jgi:lipoprotein-releasing system permease protein